MKHIRTFSILFCLISIVFIKPTFSQVKDLKSKKKISNNVNELAPLTKSDKQKLLNLPDLKFPPEYKDVILPIVVDNSLKKYMREPFNQAGYCCGQAAGIAYNFTYEIDCKRDLAANTNETTYPTHFTWNFENDETAEGGGVSYIHSFEILQKCGDPNVEDYGGTLSYGGKLRWMSGYDEYYNGMHNRINKVMTIKVDDVEGLLTLKNWINDHLNGSEVGGIASFYIQYTSSFNYLPTGTPEAGKCVITSWGGSPNHAMTIVGYHDSIRFDYNGDGRYTNDLDINYDGVVNLKDWEIGGFKAVNSYGGVPNWGDGGYTYMMYKTLADELGSGGIWNHSTHILDVKEIYEPQITAKVVIKHTARGTIKVTAGVASDETAEEPEYIYEYPIFDFQGNYNYMQGGNSIEENKTIEFGLDLTPLLNYIENGEPAKYFIRVEEEDPNNWGFGTFISFSLMDYTGGGVIEIPSPSTNVPIQHHGFTVFSVVHTINYADVIIEDDELPHGQINNPYNYQLTASGGTPPYHWELNRDFEEIVSTEDFPMVNAEQLYPSSNSSGFATKILDFSFPFYGKIHDTILIHVDGFMPFEEDMFYHPYFYNHDIVFIHHEGIYPYLYDLTLNTSDGDGIWYEGDENSATFRWKASYSDNPSATELNFAVTLYPSGKIEYYYGSFEVPENIIWYAGTSKGDEKTYQFSEVSNDDHIPINSLIEFIANDYPPEMDVSEDGVFSGVPLNAYDEKEISFRASDNNGISSIKTLEFSTKGVIIEYSVNSGGDEIIEFGETAYLSVSIKNLEDEEITDAVLNIYNSSPFIELLDDNENIGTIAVGQTVYFENAFSFFVDPSVPNKYSFNINSILTSGNLTWIRDNVFIAYAPVIEKQNIFVDDGNNGILEPGDTADLIISFKNNGDVSANEILAVLSSNDPYVNINSGSGTMPSLAPGEIGQITFNLSVSEEASLNQIIDLLVDISAEGGYTTQISFTLALGLILEDFETGDYNKLSWQHSGDTNWIIDSGTKYEGEFSARSGDVIDDQESILLIELDVLSDGDISFYKKVSCENDPNGTNYDYLSFEINEIEINRWDGNIDWTMETYPVSAGTVTFKWIFHKDYSVSSGSDCAWVDYIIFPACQSGIPELSVSPDFFNKTMNINETDFDTIYITNIGGGILNYQISLFENPKKPNINSSSKSIEGSYMSCSPEEFISGQSLSFTLMVYNGSTDNEWLKDIYVDFPEGVIINSVSDFIGGSEGDMLYEGMIGNGITAHWHGENASGWGVIKGGESAYAQVDAYFENSLPDEISFICEIDGEIYGAEPHIIYDTLNLIKTGEILTWIDVNPYFGNVAQDDTDEIEVIFNTIDLEPGEYSCSIDIVDNFQVSTSIPVSLTVFSLFASQEFELFDGFQFVSTRISPVNPEMTTVVAAIMDGDLQYIRNSAGAMLRKIGPNWVNGIGDWITSEGYLFKMAASDLLTIEGSIIEVQTPIYLSAGYQFVSYFPSIAINALDAFESTLNDDLFYIRNSTGGTLRKIGPVWVNGIGNAIPGEGYLFKMQADGVLIYPEEAKSALTITKLDPVYFPFNGGNAADSIWTIYVSKASIDGFELQSGDEIAIFDGDKLVGATGINNNILIDNQHVNEIPVFRTITSGKGFVPGKKANFRLWDESQNIEIPLENIRFLNPYNNAYSQITFPLEDGEYSIVELEFSSLLSVSENYNNSETSIQNCFPNPFRNETSISFTINEKCFADLIIFNINGEEVIRLASSDFEKGEYKIKWDGKNQKGENISNGIYYCKLISNKNISSEKLILIK